MLREVDMMTALEITLQGGTAVRVMEVQDVAGMTVCELMHSGENEYRYLVDEPEPDAPAIDEPEVESKIDTPSPETENVSENSEPEEPKKERAKPGPKTQPIDVGKIHALADAGWSQGAIASEMHLSVSTVRKYLTGVNLRTKEDDE